MEIFAELVLDRVILRSMRNLKSQNNCRKMINKLSVKFRLLRGVSWNSKWLLFVHISSDYSSSK